ncbi:AsmA family protein [Chitinophaga cymbidii]|uniref:AsmA domain-containing protein n=1 Tax=Chitinophaga cymbidii TaxID=1096750 RepID=A0A512RSB8_9BACT|nr:AsmA family protein [Chitinophaga cymbidii]GEP98591.1 hypothetical protein CCY01nite_48510 [Chitinophaga cymbidii]
MPRWLRLSLISLVSLITLVIILWLVLALIIRSNKQAILHQITEQLGGRINGTLEIKDMEPSLVRSFPNVSVTLIDVSLKDSLFTSHQRPLLKVEEVYVKVNTFAIIRKKVDIRQVFLKNGSIRLFTDSTGYSNKYLFQSKPSARPKSRQPVIGSFRLENVLLEIEDQVKSKLFRFDIRSVRGQMINRDTTGWQCDLQTDVLIRDMAFNTAKGSYAQQKVLKSNLHIEYDRSAKILRIPSQTLRFDEQPVVVDGLFSFSQKPALFNLKIRADAIGFRTAASMLPKSASQKLDSISFSQPLNVLADIKGRMQFRDTPHVNVSWNTQNNTLTAKGIELGQCSFSGGYLNEVQPGMGHGDNNSRISLYDFKGQFDSIPITADTIRVVNLKHPVLTGRFKSNFPLASLTRPMGAHLFQFTKGNASVDLEYAGSWDAKDTIPGYLKGIVQISDGAFTYVPRNQAFQQCNATLDFTGADLFIRNVKVQSGKSALLMEGSIRNILNFYFNAPEKITLDWSVNSPLINLNEFHSFFSKRQKHQRQPQKASRHHRAKLLRQLDVVLEACSVNMDVNLNKVQYRKFTAQNVKANVQLTKESIRLNKVALQAAGGSMQLNGTVTQTGNGNDKFNVDARIQQVQVDQLFHAFENFGQDGVEAKNLKGIFSATARLSGGMKEDASIRPHSMFGTIKFDLKKGALVNFEPLERIGKFVFRKRDMSNITFENISNTLDIKGNKVVIYPMVISSSVVNIELEGVYGLPKGTDIKMKIPLRNPKGDDLITDITELQKRRKRGIVVNLHAVDGEDGKVKLKLGKGKDDD